MSCASASSSESHMSCLLLLTPLLMLPLTPLLEIFTMWIMLDITVQIHQTARTCNAITMCNKESFNTLPPPSPVWLSRYWWCFVSGFKIPPKKKLTMQHAGSHNPPTLSPFHRGSISVWHESSSVSERQLSRSSGSQCCLSRPIRITKTSLTPGTVCYSTLHVGRSGSHSQVLANHYQTVIQTYHT